MMTSYGNTSGFFGVEKEELLLVNGGKGGGGGSSSSYSGRGFSGSGGGSGNSWFPNVSYTQKKENSGVRLSPQPKSVAASITSVNKNSTTVLSATLNFNYSFNLTSCPPVNNITVPSFSVGIVHSR